jgi:hypothetical protein
MAKTTKSATNSERTPIRPARTFREAVRRAPEAWREQLESLSKEELAERLTTYEPGVPHYWFGRPVAPLTKEELLIHWNGGPEPEIRYLDELQETPQGAALETAKATEDGTGQ